MHSKIPLISRSLKQFGGVTCAWWSDAKECCWKIKQRVDGFIFNGIQQLFYAIAITGVKRNLK